MYCPRCNKKVSIKKNTLVDCKCGAKLLATMINGKLEIFDLRKDDK